MRRILILLMMVMASVGLALAEDEEIYFSDVIQFNPQDAVEANTEAPQADDAAEIPAEDEAKTARDEFIDRIISMGYDLYVAADGKAQSAHFKGDIYLCKNFTTHIFNELRDDFCMAEYPDVRLRIPNNITSEDSRPYYKGVGWEQVDAEDGNPFYEVARFRYDNDLSEAENLEMAMAFMRQAQRGDFFQMNADYEYGTGPHSAIMLGYDAETDEIHWMDSNMRGYKNKKGIRYGICQFDEVKSVEWWASAFCHKKRGATLYRLRDDIAFREEVQ